MFAYLSREMASAILLDEQGDKWQYYRKLCVCDRADILLKSGAKLKHNEKEGFYVSGYFTNGSDVQPYIKEYGAILHPHYLTNI
jgi:hypothetical protein